MWLVVLLALLLPAPPTEILWDSWGVPHIRATDERSLFRAFGQAQAESRGELLIRLYGQARGRAAEYWGPEYLESDRWVRTNGIPERARAWYKAQTPSFRADLDAFAEGVNAGLKGRFRVTAVDVLAHTQRVIHFHFVTSPQAGAGSNAWAVAPSRSLSGHALLIANPHLPWRDMYLFYEAQLVCPGVDAYGAALVGFPVLGIAFNDHLAWTHTVNTHDGQDWFALEERPGGYLWEGKVRPFEVSRVVLKVLGAPSETLVVRRSVHGPVFGSRALRVVGLDQPGMLQQWWDMARARDLAGFQSVLKRLQLPTFTVMYADTEGHIMHLFGGRTPVRSPGDYSGTVPGVSAANLWTRTHPYEDLPLVVDPPSGWLQNSNDPPWTTTFPALLDPSRFPAYLAPRTMSFRAQRSVRLLSSAPHMSLEELIVAKHSTRMELADRILDEVLALPTTRPLARQAQEILSSWDRCADAESRGAVLFQEFVKAAGRGLFAVPFDPADPLRTPRGLGGAAAIESALETAGSVGAVAWGERYKLPDGEPANGAPGDLGVVRVLYPQVPGGDSYVAALEMTSPPRARVLLAYGNASEGPHHGDQLRLFARKELRPVWRTRQEVLEHLERRETMTH